MEYDCRIQLKTIESILNMPKYVCEYCNVYLTHDSQKGRKQHSRGNKHQSYVRAYYDQLIQSGNTNGVQPSNTVSSNVTAIGGTIQSNNKNDKKLPTNLVIVPPRAYSCDPFNITSHPIIFPLGVRPPLPPPILKSQVDSIGIPSMQSATPPVSQQHIPQQSPMPHIPHPQQAYTPPVSNKPIESMNVSAVQSAPSGMHPSRLKALGLA